MPLSEEELRLLEQMERALSEEDPKFASTLRGTTIRQVQRRRAVLAGVIFIVGIVVLMTGAIAQLIPVGVAGFVIMLCAATFGLTSLRGTASASPSEARASGRGGFSVIDGGKKSRRPKQRSGGSFMDRMEDRWRRRRDQGF